jgi:uncharacterized protein (TIGR02145 family)
MTFKNKMNLKRLKDRIMKTTMSKTTAIGIALVMFCTFWVNAQTMKDINGNEYKTIKYGVQEWSASNLNVTSFRNGDAIPEAKTTEEWIKAGAEGKPAWCYYKNDPENGKIYGKLYNWYAINDSRGLAPEGWKIPGAADWMTLVKNLLGVDVAGLKLKNKTGWKSKNGSNMIGFTALPAGYRNEDGDYHELETKCMWWTNTEPVEPQKSNMIYTIMLNDFTVELAYIKTKKELGCSVRCIKEAVKK